MHSSFHIRAWKDPWVLTVPARSTQFTALVVHPKITYKENLKIEYSYTRIFYWSYPNPIEMINFVGITQKWIINN